MRIVVDCGHGAAYRVAPDVLSELGAEVIPIGVKPDGENINQDCGSLYPEAARQALLEHSADLAISLDGDADRAVFVDEKGEVVDGDHVLAICAKEMREKGTLNGSTVVATVMSNLGLELALDGLGVQIARTQVGDRYVVEEMVRGGYNLGGEQSGHLLFLDEKGEVVDGDHVLAICAKEMREKGTLNGSTVVATVMSNLGLELALDGLG